MVAQPAGVDARRHETVSQGVHLDQRRELGRVAEIVAVLAAAHRGATVRLARPRNASRVPFQPVPQEGERQAGEVAAAADAADHHVREVLGQFELLFRFQADHRLVQHHVVQHAAQGVLGVVAGGGHFDRLADGDAQAAGAIRDRPPGSAARPWSRWWGWPPPRPPRGASSSGDTASDGSSP